MNRALSSTVRLLLATVVLTSTLLLPGKAEILDPDAAKHPLLSSIASDLDSYGIDVVQDWRSKVQVGSRPVIAPLSNYQISLAPRMASWMRSFNRGVLGAVAAIKSDESLSRDEFEQKWNKMPKAKRVFISFAREDAQFAQRVQASLAAQGYVAFIYLKNATERPAQSPLTVGKYLRTAGTHLVIDTQTARRKPGVLAELVALSKYTRPPDSEPPVEPGSPSKGRGERLTATKESSLSTRRPVVEIYGAKARCPRTRQAIQIFVEAGAEVRYYDVDSNPRAARVVNRNLKWLDHDNLPFIRVNGKPIKATSAGLTECLQKFPTRYPQ